MASWRSGYAEDCKSLHPGSIPGEASSKSTNSFKHPETCPAQLIVPHGSFRGVLANPLIFLFCSAVLQAPKTAGPKRPSGSNIDGDTKFYAARGIEIERCQDALVKFVKHGEVPSDGQWQAGLP